VVSERGYALHQNKGLKHATGADICSNHQPPFGTTGIHLPAIHCKHHSWSTDTIGYFCPRISIHHYKESHTWIHYIHWSTTFLVILQRFYAAQRGSTTSTTTHATLQTLGIFSGLLHSALSHSANFKQMLRTLQEVSESLP